MDLVTNKNNALAVLDGFAYRKHKLNNAKTTQYWRCVNVQKGCRGRAVGEAGSREVRITQDHSDGCGAFENGVSLELRKLRTSRKASCANTGTRGSPVREVVSQEVAAASLSEDFSRNMSQQQDRQLQDTSWRLSESWRNAGFRDDQCSRNHYLAPHLARMQSCQPQRSQSRGANLSLSLFLVFVE
ncbi:hypothetical protein L596_024890 [Steinernema carpocapsae]|uniref:FLYWCH-type domain-containing protein n=1 Tax=Steinernema carpocapsae TaxID=34508 RepID=A0A4U5M663_STECR|nr:hypothetical protein L596_024890 [Steinernema carpocapsae]